MPPPRRNAQRRDDEQRPDDRSRSVLGFRLRRLDLIHDGRTFLRRRGIEHERLGGLLVHFLDGPDPGLDLHDHPWSFATLVLRGGYTEEWCEARLATKHHFPVPPPGGTPTDRLLSNRTRLWPRWSLHRMPLHVAHRITSVRPGTVTLLYRRPKGRRWGFFLPTGWVDGESYPYDERRPMSVASDRPEEVR
jgi:hypothetical protein